MNVTDSNSSGVTVPHLQAVVAGNWQNDVANPVGTQKSFSMDGNRVA